MDITIRKNGEFIGKIFCNRIYYMNYGMGIEGTYVFMYNDIPILFLEGELTGVENLILEI